MANEITFDKLPQAVVYLTEQVTSSISMSFLTKFSASSPSCTPRASGGKQKLITMTLLVTLISTYARDMVTGMRAVLCGTKTASASVFMGEVWISISASGSTARAWAITPDWSIIIARCEFRDELREHRFELLKDLVRFFKEYMPHYGYKHLCTEDDDYKYYQTLNLPCIKR